MTPAEKPWYQRARYIVPAVVGIALLYGAGASQTAPSQSQVASVAQTVSQVPETSALPTVTPLSETSVSPVSPPTVASSTKSTAPTKPTYYTNVDGNKVPSPTHTPDNSIPTGASAQCRDGSYSFSQHHSGTCSHHGGVARWL